MARIEDENKIVFTAPKFWWAAIMTNDDGSETGFVCGSCGKERKNAELSMQMEVDGGQSGKPICAECHSSFLPPKSMASKVFR